jgi:hypothetical protein
MSSKTGDFGVVGRITGHSTWGACCRDELLGCAPPATTLASATIEESFFFNGYIITKKQ